MREAYLKWSLKLYLSKLPKWVICSGWFNRITRTAAYTCDFGSEAGIHGKENLLGMVHVM